MDSQAAPPQPAQAGQPLVGQLLRSLGRISDADLAAALEFKNRRGIKLGQALVALNLVTESELSEALRNQGKIHCIELVPELIDRNVARTLGAERSRALATLAVNRIAGVTTVAMEDPSDAFSVDEIALRLQTPVLAVHAEPSRIRECLDAVFPPEVGGDDFEGLLESLSAHGLDVLLDVPDALEEGDLSEPVDSFVRCVLEEAWQAKASDVHFEPQASGVAVRVRVDGAMVERLVLPSGWAIPLLERLEALADLAVSQRGLPRDGRTHIEVHGQRVGLHVASVPTVHGVSVVLRVLDGRWESRPLATLDLDSERLELLRETAERPDGLVLITGPAGSGRTTTLYALLHERRRSESKLVTVEDPVAHPMDGVTQIEVDLASGLTFERGLEAALRQAPDVLLLGEILTPAAAQGAVRASLTGHLLLSCLNTPGTTEAVTRLFAMGVAPYLLADTLRAIVAQRLVRRLCENCREARRPAPEILRRAGLEADSRAEFFVGLGCESCRHTGYRGRLGLYEVLPVTHEIGSLIASEASGPELREAAIQAGFTSLRADAVRKAALGETSLSEALSATSSGAAR